MQFGRGSYIVNIIRSYEGNEAIICISYSSVSEIKCRNTNINFLFIYHG